MSEFSKVLNKKAVALKYDEDAGKAPIIVASGKGHMAEKIIETASENGVPVYEDDSLASVLTQLNIGCEIPQEVYQTVVDIYLYFLQFVPKTENVEKAKNAEPMPQEEQAAQD